MSGELSTFEQKSAMTPKNTPFGILGGTILAVIIFILVSMFASNDAVKDLKGKDDNAASTDMAPAATSGGGDVEDI